MNGLRDAVYEGDDDGSFLRIFREFAKLVRASAELCDRAHEGVVENEIDYVEELLGLSFVFLQVKINKVEEAARFKSLNIHKLLCAKFNESEETDKANSCKVRHLDDTTYNNTGETLASLIWDLGNYYKHRDEWGSEVWSGHEPDYSEVSKKDRTKIKNQIKQARRTWMMVKKISGGSMRSAYDFFGIDWTSDCTPLAEKVQEWAQAVYETSARTPTIYSLTKGC